LILVDEGAYVDPNLLCETIFPVLEVKNAVLVIITTPLGPGNIISLLIMMKNRDGSSFFCVIAIGLVCPDCKKLPLDAMLECKHLDHLRPRWKSGYRHDRFVQVTKAVDQQGAGRGVRENMGESASEFSPAFPGTAVVHMCDDSNVYTIQDVLANSAPKCIYVAVDPAGDGASRCAVISGFYTYEKSGMKRLVVCPRPPPQSPPTHAHTFFLIFISYSHNQSLLLFFPPTKKKNTSPWRVCVYIHVREDKPTDDRHAPDNARVASAAPRFRFSRQ